MLYNIPPLWQRLLLIIITIFLPFFYFSYLNRYIQLDDALIYQRYIRNALAGNGLVYNPSELFNGLTSPLYTYLVLLFSFVLKNIQFATILVSTFCMSGTIWVFMQIFNRYTHSYTVVLGGILLCYSPYFYLTYGMETSLFIFLVGLCIYLFEVKNIFWLGITCALLLLTRSEGIFLVVAMAIEHFRQKRPFPTIRYFILPALIISIHYIFNKWYYGDFLPHTASAKIYQGQSGLWELWQQQFLNMDNQVKLFFYSNESLAIGFVLLALIGIVSLRFKSINIISIIFMGLYTAFFVILNIPGYTWYYAPYYIFLPFYASIGIVQIISLLLHFKSYQRLFYSTPRFINNSALILSSLLLFQNTYAHVDGLSYFIADYRKIGNWLKNNTPDNSKIACVEIGTIGWYSERPIIDILGLISPFNAQFIAERDFDSWLTHYSPDYILIHKPIWIFETGVTKWEQQGKLIEERKFSFKDFRLLKLQKSPNRILRQQK